MILATSQAAVGVVILFITVVVAVAYAFLNVRAGRAEVGSEIELAPNRKPYVSDEELEGRKLDRTLTLGLLGIFVLAVGLPLYWLAEPGRQSGAVAEFGRRFDSRGKAMFDTTANGGFNCAFCHGGLQAQGSQVDYTITDANGQFVRQVKWKAPALNTVLLRYSRDEVRYILTYGRPFSPMPAWGLKGGGPLNDQQLQNLIDYLQSIQLTPKQAQKEVLAGLQQEMDLAKKAGKPYGSEGEALFNLGYYSNFAGGAYACARCHTQGWSYGDKAADGSGAMGPNLRGGDAVRQFPGTILGFNQQVDFVCSGSDEGKLYGRQGQGSGRMPGFCSTPEEKADNPLEVGVNKKDASDPVKVGGMLTKQQVEAIVRYERSL